MNIEIDKLTPCLERVADNEIVNTSFSYANKSELNKLSNWLFDWTSSELNDCEIYKLTVDNDERIQGLIALQIMNRDRAVYVKIAESAPQNKYTDKEFIGVGGHLFAIAVQRSYELGFGGYDYLYEMEEAVAVKHEYSKTGNNDVDSLINYELSLAADLGSAIIYDVNLPERLNISSFDMTIILGNLMDNAIEALKHSERKMLKVNIQFNKGIIRIDIENSYDPTYKKKNDGREHGIGLLSVENTLQKYHGKLDSYPEESNYHTTAVFYNSKE